MEYFKNKNNRYQINTPNGFVNFDGIQKVNRKEYLLIEFENKINIKCSINHPFILPNNKIIKSNDLKIGDYLKSKNGKTKITNIKLIQEDIELYDLINVSNGNIFYSNDIVSHNCEFLGSSGTLIAGAKLKQLAYKNPIERRWDNLFNIYELPLNNQIYVIICDVSEGVGQDSSVVQVFKINSNKTYEQVAIYRNNEISLIDFPLIIEKIALFYNDALTIVESNSIGQSVINDIVYDLEIENVFKDDDYGIKMTKTSKRLGCSHLKNNIEDNFITLNDDYTIKELYSFVKRGDTYKAVDGKHDDTITPLVIFSYFLRNSQWMDLYLDADIRKATDSFNDALINDLLPIGFIKRNGQVKELGNYSKVRLRNF